MCIFINSLLYCHLLTKPKSQKNADQSNLIIIGYEAMKQFDKNIGWIYYSHLKP